MVYLNWSNDLINKDTDNLVKRLSKIEGQVRGISKMIESERYCIDVLSQTRAVVAAIRKVEDKIMENHLHTCVKNSMQSSNEFDQNKKIDEIMEILSKFRKNG